MFVKFFLIKSSIFGDIYEARSVSEYGTPSGYLSDSKIPVEILAKLHGYIKGFGLKVFYDHSEDDEKRKPKLHLKVRTKADKALLTNINVGVFSIEMPDPEKLPITKI